MLNDLQKTEFSSKCSRFFLFSVTLLAISCAELEGKTDQLFHSIRIDKHEELKEHDYICIYKKLEPDVTYYITGFKPVNPLNSAHHLLMYACVEPAQYADYWNCGNSNKHGGSQGTKCIAEEKETILFVGSNSALQLPDDVSFKVGKGTDYAYLVVQIHFNSPDKLNADDSIELGPGLAITYQTDPTRYTGSMTTLATEGGLVTPGLSHVDGVCTPDAFSRQMKIVAFAYRVHTHGRGTFVSAFRVRDKVEIDAFGKRRFWSRRQGSREQKEWTLIGARDPREEQIFIPMEKELLISETDTIATRCIYVNNGSKNVIFGQTGKEEMCVVYLMFYVVKDIELFESSGVGQCYLNETHSKWTDHEDELGPVPEWVTKLSIQW